MMVQTWRGKKKNRVDISLHLMKLWSNQVKLLRKKVVKQKSKRSALGLPLLHFIAHLLKNTFLISLYIYIYILGAQNYFPAEIWYIIIAPSIQCGSQKNPNFFFNISSFSNPYNFFEFTNFPFTAGLHTSFATSFVVNGTYSSLN